MIDPDSAPLPLGSASIHPGSATLQLGSAAPHARPDALVIVVGALFLIFYVALRRGWRPKWRLNPRTTGSGLKGVRIKPMALLPGLLLLAVIAALVISHS